MFVACDHPLPGGRIGGRVRIGVGGTYLVKRLFVVVVVGMRLSFGGNVLAC